MKLIKLYKPLTYFLILPSTIIGLFSFFGFFIAIANPPVLLDVFITACAVVYFIGAFIFFWRTIVCQKTCKKIIKDLIKINGYISVLFTTKIILAFIALMIDPTVLKATIDAAMAQNAATFPAAITSEMVIKFAWLFMILLTIYATVLLIHIIITFRLLKEFASSFISE